MVEISDVTGLQAALDSKVNVSDKADQPTAEAGINPDKWLSAEGGGQLFDKRSEPSFPSPFVNVFARSLAAFRGQQVNISDLGVVLDGSLSDFGDVGTDNTDALNDIFALSGLADKTLHADGGVCRLKHLEIRDMQRVTFLAPGLTFFGVSEDDYNSIIHIHNVARSHFTWRMLTTDGNRSAVAPGGKFRPHYGCLLQVSTNNMTDEGAWSVSSASYATTDMVMHGGSYYVCYTAHTSDADTEPGVGVDWATVWHLLPDEDAYTPDYIGTTPCSDNVFDIGLSMHPYLMAYGSLPTSPERQQRAAQDQNSFKIYARSGLVPIICKARASGLETLPGTTFETIQFSASSAWWTESSKRWIVNEGGDNTYVKVNGGLFISTIAGGYGFYGGQFDLNNYIEENPNSHYVTGHYRAQMVQRGYRGPPTTNPIYLVDPAATGRLVLSEVESRRKLLGSATITTASMLVDARGNKDLDIVIAGGRYEDMPWDGANAKHAVMGGKSLVITGGAKLFNADDATSFNFNVSGVNRLARVADCTGAAMSAVAGTAADQGWTGTVATHAKVTSGALPPNATSAIEIVSSGTGVIVSPSGTSGFQVDPGRDHLVSGWLCLISGVGQLTMQVVWYNRAGTLISTTSIFNQNESVGIPGEFTKNKFIDDSGAGGPVGQRFYAAAKAPVDAHFGRFGFTHGATALTYRLGDLAIH